jgi:hypothetical protein
MNIFVTLFRRFAIKVAVESGCGSSSKLVAVPKMLSGRKTATATKKLPLNNTATAAIKCLHLFYPRSFQDGNGALVLTNAATLPLNT